MNIHAGLRLQIVRVILTSGALLAVLVGAPSPAAAAGLMFVVNKNTDAPDRNLADGKCDVSTKSGKQCTLRAAIQQANSSGGPNVIAFGLPSTARTIAPSSPLPLVTDDGIKIDGYSQNGASANTAAVGDNAVIKVTLDGINAGSSVDGLVLGADDSLVQGLDIQRFGSFGVAITGAHDTLSGNFIGVNAAGTKARGNGGGVYVEGVDAFIGGKKAAGRNVISGNTLDGIQLSASPDGSGLGTVLSGNFVGTNAKGNAALGNGDNGVIVRGSGTLVGLPFGAQNVISGNVGYGVFVVSTSSCTIENTWIGTGADGTSAVPNGQSGIGLVASGPDWIGPGNVIANNVGNGVFLGNASTGTEIFQSTITSNGRAGVSAVSGPQTIHDNTISSNGGDGIEVQSATATGIDVFANAEQGDNGLGIDLRGGTEDSFSVTANDASDSDTGANDLQNFPVISSAISNRFTNKTTVAGSISSEHNQDYRVEVFIADTDASGHGEGETSLGSVTVNSGASGTTSWSVVAAHVPPGTHVTATATLLDDDSTSEFSSNVLASGS